MYITRKSLPRRTFLKGAGTLLALPLLESMVPSMTALAQTPAKGTLRFGACYVPNGATMAHWMPKAGSNGLEITPILSPLEKFKSMMNVVGNISRAGGLNATDHAVSSAGWLSGVTAKQTEAEDISLGITIDQVLAKHIGQDNPFPSLEVATEDFSGYVGGCVPGYSCTYMNTISWAGATAPLPMETNPRVTFERMFGRAGTPAQRLARMHENRSILDSITDEARSLQGKVTPQDRARLGDYLENVREIERRIQKTEASNAKEVEIDAPIGVPATFEEHAAVIFDLMAVAYQADLTRIFTFMMSREASQRTYPVLGISQPHHDVSHHAQQPDKMALHAKINAHYVGLFAKFVDTLANMPDGDGSVLDHTLLVYGHGMSDGQAHNSYPLPLATVGGLGGQLRGDRFVVAPDWTPVANLWLSVADMYGVRLDSFGESTGRVTL